jgi:hypothetical protein
VTAAVPARPPLRVASVPSAGAYLDAVLPAESVRVGAATGSSPWWDPAHLVAAAGDVDVLHVHSGYESLSSVQLEAWTATVRRSGLPLVVTVHQLRPVDGSSLVRHRAQLAALLATAEVVLTLTRGAADEIADRYGRTAIVVAHPCLAAPTPGVGRETRLVGLYLGRLDPEVAEPAGLVRGALSGAVSGGGRLRVDVHPDVDLPAALPELAGYAAAGELELRRSHPRDATARVRTLQELHVSVLPHRACTHSSWVELCRDAGTRVVVPRGGYLEQQWSDVVAYDNDARTGLDPTSLSSAVVAALTRPAPGRADQTWRTDQRDAVRRVHTEVYAQVAGDRVSA